uniref:Putative reverse transcriptase/maturase n=1 Tax=Bulboplastis apyrenoidosa TaxID=1070855 RepID=A0A1X9PTN7_9RHOD|nr:putative reverse transcriptase/maturase [Bulboplastis apyrenoidosa]YP_009370300.1 putative reverse transcriptase/maturase [Bulboplastis apyrenoidosa]ARO90750.1 putative reverse transcriptase/maturase [Bulboplastis apyrenoidosa]ARO90789.1 putative reverse transcriptase/maturase [Bulboplastis apyrenoidosa]
MQPTLKRCVEDWNALPWKKFQKDVFRLQHRIYKARQAENYKLVSKLQRLLFQSRAVRFLAIRQITQLNRGKVTAGVDGIARLNVRERLRIFEDLNDLKNYKHQPLKRIYIPKPNGEKRPLGIPTIKDRIVQCMLKYTLEPVYEAYASKGSWGFRPGRSTHDVLMQIFVNLKKSDINYEKRILELDIEKCFDKINHDRLMEEIYLPTYMNRIIRSALKAGVLKEREATHEGTPQGGVISPLLCNIILHGIEDLWNQPYKYFCKDRSVIRSKKSEIAQRGIRYADDIVFFLQEGEQADQLRKKIDDFLIERGLKVKEAKTHLVKSTKGFDFLGWRFEVKPNHSLTCRPSKKNRIQMIKKIKTKMKDCRLDLKKRLEKVKVIYRGWRNYHQYCDLSTVNLWSINEWVYKFVKKANNKLKRKKRTEAKVVRIEKIQDIFNNHKFALFKHVAVKSDKSPFDNDWIYWSNRKNKQYDRLKAKMLKRQKFRCGECNLKFASDDQIDLHHIDGSHENNSYRNLIVLHRSCHQHQPIHGLKRSKVRT